MKYLKKFWLKLGKSKLSIMDKLALLVISEVGVQKS
jgi:hypothetical protein